MALPLTQNMIDTQNVKTEKCFFCKGNHLCKNCPLESHMSTYLKL